MKAKVIAVDNPMPLMTSIYFRTPMICNSVRRFRSALHSAADTHTLVSGSKISFTICRSVNQFNHKKWDNLVGGKSIFLSTAYLIALSESSVPDTLRFITFTSGEKLVGVAALQVTGFTSSDISGNLDVTNRIVKFLSKKLAPPAGTESSVLVVGNAFATGEHAFCFADEVLPKAAMDSLCLVVTQVLEEEEKSGRKISAVLVKDFNPQSNAWPEALARCGFATFSVDRNMVMPVLPDWKSFDDYMASLNSKFRTKALSALRKSSGLSIAELPAELMTAHSAEMKSLFAQVIARADFKMGDLTIESLIAMKKKLGDDMIVRGYFLEKRLVGFLVAFVYNRVFDAHIVGFDYSLNRAYAIYQTILYGYIREAIEIGVCEIRFGRTAGEIKSSVGALPVELSCCIKHTSKLSNFLLNILFAYVKPSDFPKRHPYKKEIEQKIESEIMTH